MEIPEYVWVYNPCNPQDRHLVSTRKIDQRMWDQMHWRRHEAAELAQVAERTTTDPKPVL